MSCILLLLFVSSAYATSCGFSAFSDDDKDEILQIHNDLRSSIAKGTFVAGSDAKPAGADIQTMGWDCSLEQSAQAWADTCPTGHSTSENGENIHKAWSTQPIPIAGRGGKASTNWANEFQKYGWPSNTFGDASNPSGIGHATQMAWAKTNKIGCGVKICPSTNPQYEHYIIAVCQYSPAGNYNGENIYTAGETCSQCDSCDSSTGLCSA